MITTDPNDPRLHNQSATGQNPVYLVLSEEERAKGFVRPFRTTYRHVGVRPRYPLRDLTSEELANPFGYVKREDYPESEAPLAGRYWTAAQLQSGCGAETVMGRALAETYARKPDFYGATYCVGCGKHFPVAEFVWLDNSRVGS